MSAIKYKSDQMIAEDNKSSKLQTPSANETQNLGQSQSKPSTSNNSNRVKPKLIGHYILGMIFRNS